MKDIIWLIRNKLTMIFSKKKNVFLYLFVPLIGIFIAFIAYGGQGQMVLHVGIVNLDNGEMSADTIHFLKGLENVKISEIDVAQLDDQITSGKLDCAITFDSNYTKSVIAGDPKGIKITSIKGAQVTSFVKSYLYNYIDNIAAISNAAKGNQQTFNKLYQQYQDSAFHFTSKTLKDTSVQKGMTYQTIGFLIMIMLMSSGNMSEIILKERENRTYFRLMASPIDAKKYVFSNVAVNMIVLTLQILITLFVMTTVFHIDSSIPLWQMALILFVFALIAVGLSLMIVAFSTNSNTVNAIQNIVVTPSCLLAGCFWPVEIMPKTAQKIAEFLPQRWVLDTITSLQTGSHFTGLYLNFMILLAFAIAFFLIAVYKFGRNNSVINFV